MVDMRLITYLEREAVSVTAFAALINRDPSSVSRVVRGKTRPDWDTLQEIVRATNGEVTPNDFLDAQEDTPNGGPRAEGQQPEEAA